MLEGSKGVGYSTIKYYLLPKFYFVYIIVLLHRTDLFDRIKYDIPMALEFCLTLIEKL